MGAYCGALARVYWLGLSGDARPARRWNWRTRRHERPMTAFDYLIFAIMVLPLVLAAIFIVAASLFL
jgi:hypothetical protein